METIGFEINGFHHQASLHRAMSNRVNKTIVYYHGGGFIFGSKDDLPSHAIDHFTKAGFDLLCMDYPKAPEMKLPQICDFIEKQLLWFLDNCHNMNLSDDYILFGRSAGGYLALYLAERIMDLEVKKPMKLIVFYGYSTFDDSEFIFSNSYYNSFPIMNFDDIKSAIEDQPVFQSNLFKRYPLYIYARQSGKWLQLLGISKDIEKFAIDISCLAFPRIFLAASKYDRDVNYKHSLMIHESGRLNELFISISSEHEFDQKPSYESTELYRRLIAWL